MSTYRLIRCGKAPVWRNVNLWKQHGTLGATNRPTYTEAYYSVTEPDRPKARVDVYARPERQGRS